MFIDSFVQRKKAVLNLDFPFLIRMEFFEILILLRCHLCSHGQLFAPMVNFLRFRTCGILIYPIAFVLSSHSSEIAAGPINNKRDAATAGLAWPANASRSSQSPSIPDDSNSNNVASSSDPASPPSGTLTYSMTGNETLTPSITLLILILLLLFQNRNILIQLLTGKDATPNGLFIRFTSRSLPTPTTNGSSSLTRSRAREFQELGIRNISFMASRDNGSGQSKQLIIGAIILAFPYIIATTLSRTISWRMLRLLVTRHDHRSSRLWLRNYLNPCRLLRHLGNLVISGEWSNA